MSPIDLNNSAPSCQPGPHLYVLSDCLFEGELLESKHSESNILVASENMVIESLTQMRKGLRNDEESSFAEDLLRNTELIFDKTPYVGLPSPSDLDKTEEDNTIPRWDVQKRMVPITTKGKEKVIEETPKRKPSTKATTQKLMGDALKTDKTSITENKRRRKSGEVKIDIPVEGVLVVSNELSESDMVPEDIPLAKGRGKEPPKKKEKEKSKGRIEASYVAEEKSEQGLGTKRKRTDKKDTKHEIVDNLHLQKVLGGRVFNPTIIMKPGMNSLADLVEIQSWTHLFMTKCPILHEEQVREFYYNVDFTEDGSLNTLVGDKSVHLNIEVLGGILEVPREGTRSVVGKICSQNFANECSKLPDAPCKHSKETYERGVPIVV
ncbi:hypothetical protein KY290_017176 [Solanum tuberosum]|uniref:Ulp1 protease family, C-terminal catalytic domain containing protein n=1 Tax=Solanum tuberosum TaxID=4113 RepID=A0ABQ7VAK0_SOLTU|nr:hypothetical protein KY290_017176 [Solanum tuberosum]